MGRIAYVNGRFVPQGEAVVHIPNVVEDEAYRSGDSTRRALVEIGGCRSLLSVALRKENTVLGAISVYRQEARPSREVHARSTSKPRAPDAARRSRLFRGETGGERFAGRASPAPTASTCTTGSCASATASAGRC